MRLDRQETRAAPQSHKALRLKQIIPYDPFHNLFIRLRHIESSTAITTATKTIATPHTKALRNPICSKLIKSQPTIAKRAVDSRLIKKRRSDIFSRRFSIARLYLAKVNYLKELRDTLDTEALQELQEFLAETMDRHADKSARDDRESSNSTPRTKAEGFCDDFARFYGAGAGIYLDDNEQARAVESSKIIAKANAHKH